MAAIRSQHSRGRAAAALTGSATLNILRSGHQNQSLSCERCDQQPVRGPEQLRASPDARGPESPRIWPPCV